ncbi:hypothetical protein D3C72_1851360 [compost metagenome]
MKKHQDWWQNYYSASSLFLPDKLYQSFYDMQLYKLASATRADKPAMDLQGPWTSPTPWPAYWMNLNLQLAYSPVFTSNHLDIASSLIQMIDRNISNLRENVPPAYRYNSIAIGRSSANDLWSPVVLEKGVSIADASDGEKSSETCFGYCIVTILIIALACEKMCMTAYSLCLKRLLIIICIY